MVVDTNTELNDKFLERQIEGYIFRQLSPICLLCISQKPIFQCTMVVSPSYYFFGFSFFQVPIDDLLLHLQLSIDLIPYTSL